MVQWRLLIFESIPPLVLIRIRVSSTIDMMLITGSWKLGSFQSVALPWCQMSPDELMAGTFGGREQQFLQVTVLQDSSPETPKKQGLK